MTSLAIDSLARGSELSFPRFAGELFAQLDARRIRYCILHSYEGLPETADSDIDIAVAPVEFDRLPGVIAALDALGYHAVQCLNYAVHGYYFVFCWAADSSVCTAAVDFISQHREGQLILTSGEELVRGRRRFRDFWIPSVDAAYRYLLSKKVLKGSVSERQALRLTELAIELGRDEARKICTRLFGPRWGVRAADATLDGNLGDVLGRLKLALWRRVLGRQPWMPVWYQISDLPRKASRLATRTGFLVAVLGPDGAGKSTVIQRLGEQLDGVFRSRHVFHWRPRLLFPGRFRPVTNPHGQRRFGIVRSLAHLAGHFADYQIGFVLRIRPLLAQTGLVLFDRYFYDLTADPKRYRYSGPARIPEILSRSIARPDLALVLDAPEEILLRRKAETTAREMRLARERYRRLADHEFARRIDASQAPEAVALEACNAVVAALRSRFASRYGRWLRPSAAKEVEEVIFLLGGRPSEVHSREKRQCAVLPGFAAPRWMVPLNGTREDADRISVYTPYKLKARLLRIGLSVAMRAPSSIWARHTVSLPAKGPLDELVHDVLGESNADFTISLGTPGRYRKATIQITARGRVCGFLKAPLTPEAGERVRREASVLARLSALPRVLEFVPSVLFAGELGGRFVLFQTPLGGKPGGIRLRGEHRSFLDELAQVEPEQRRVRALVDEIGWNWEAVAGLLDTRGRKTVERTLHLIERDYSPGVVACGFIHGDFAPWNTRREDGGLRVFDWESAEAHQPRDWDIFHFQTQTASLLRRDAGYRFDRRRPEARCSYALYLVHSICRLLTEGAEGDKGIGFRLRRLEDEFQRGEGGRP